MREGPGVTGKTTPLRAFLVQLVGLALLLPALAAAQASFYQWTDRSGRVHVVDHIDKVPPQYQSRATKIVGRRTPSKAPQEPPSAAAEAAPPAPLAAPRRPFTYADLYDSYVQSALWLVVPGLLFSFAAGGIASYLGYRKLLPRKPREET